MNVIITPEKEAMIKAEMAFAGFDMSRILFNEAKLYDLVGENNFREVIKEAFEHAYLERDYIKSKGPGLTRKEFIELCEIRRYQKVERALECTLNCLEKTGSIGHYKSFDREEMKKEISRIYSEN